MLGRDSRWLASCGVRRRWITDWNELMQNTVATHRQAISRTPTVGHQPNTCRRSTDHETPEINRITASIWDGRVDNTVDEMGRQSRWPPLRDIDAKRERQGVAALRRPRERRNLMPPACPGARVMREDIHDGTRPSCFGGPCKICGADRLF
jgi:hypothetical protein